MPASPIALACRTLALGAGLALGACAAQAPQDGSSADGRVAATPPGRVVGEPVNCIQLSRIRDTEVHGDEVIDFEMAGGMTYRNTLPNRCPSLGFEKRFAYQTTTGQLCSTDIIYVLYSDGTRGPGCGLGTFLPIDLGQASSQPPR